MTAFLTLPIGAILILLLHLLKMPRRLLLGVFFATLVFSFAAALGEIMLGVRTHHICTIFRIDDFTRFFILIFTGVTGLAAWGFFDGEKSGSIFSLRLTEIIAPPLLLAAFAMALVAASTSVIALFLSMEFLAIAFYELVALKKNRIGMEAAIKFFVVGVFSSLLFLLGAAFYFGATGTTDFSVLSVAQFSPFLVAALVLMLAGIGFKMSIFPLNLWLPDVYQGAPSRITAILAGAAKKAGFAAYLRMFMPLTLPMLALTRSMASWQMLMALFAAFTMLFGVFAAAVQQNVKRMIAYSIIAHAGFIAIGLAAATRFGYRAALLHMAIHALMAVGVFAMIGALEREGITELDDYNGIAKRMPLFGVVFAVFLASLTGLPPLAGFLSKFLLFTSAVESGMVWLAVVAVITSVISSYFYFVVLRRMFGFESPTAGGLDPSDRDMTFAAASLLRAPWIVPAFLLMVFGILPHPLLWVIDRIV